MTNRKQPRGSIFTGLLLILLGALVLLHRYYPELGLGHMIRVYWPILIIAWGVAKLIEYFLAREPGDARPPFLSGLEVLLVIILGFVFSGFVFRDWFRERYPQLRIEIPPLHQTSPETKRLPPQHLPAGAHVIIDTTRGDIVVHGIDGDELQVSAGESAAGDSESEAQSLLKNADLAIDHSGNAYTIYASKSGERGSISADFDVQLPKTASLAAHTSHGDISVSGMGADLDARSDSGDVEVRDAKANVNIGMNSGDARATGVGGNLRITGRANDIEVADAMGDVTLDGTFLGSASVRNAAKTVHYASPRADVTVSQMSGRLTIDSDDVEIAEAVGPVKIMSQNKDVKVENVAGRLDITNSHGDINIELKSAPRADMNIANVSADVDLTLPSQSSFEILAGSRSGDVDSDFQSPSLKTSNEDGSGQIVGKFGNDGPRIVINTTYGTIHLHKGP
jgi:DUF4097 and DUF4098 domain-containing protein YvlB